MGARPGVEGAHPARIPEKGCVSRTTGQAADVEHSIALVGSGDVCVRGEPMRRRLGFRGECSVAMAVDSRCRVCARRAVAAHGPSCGEVFPNTDSRGEDVAGTSASTFSMPKGKACVSHALRRCTAWATGWRSVNFRRSGRFSLLALTRCVHLRLVATSRFPVSWNGLLLRRQ